MSKEVHMDEATMEEMAKAYHEALKGKKFPKTRPFPDSNANPVQSEPADDANGTIVALLTRELAAVEFLLQCAVKEDKKRLLSYLRNLLYEVVRRYPAGTRTVDTDRFLSPETAKARLCEYAVDRLAETDRLEREEHLYSLNSRILALITLI